MVVISRYKLEVLMLVPHRNAAHETDTQERIDRTVDGCLVNAPVSDRITHLLDTERRVCPLQRVQQCDARVSYAKVGIL
jgi:hypothetical protein